MRRFAPVGLAIFLLLLLSGCGPGIGLDRDPRPLCTVGCILDVYPCVDPVTNRPASEVGPHCPTLPFDTVVHSLAWDALLLALAALALLVGIWWWLGHRPAKEPPDDGDGPSRDSGQLTLPGLLAPPSTAAPDTPTPARTWVRLMQPIGLVLAGLLAVGAMALWEFHRPLYYLPRFCAEPVDYVDALLGAYVARFPADEACSVGVGTRTLAVGAISLALVLMASLSVLRRGSSPAQARLQPDAPQPPTSSTDPQKRPWLRRSASVVVAVVAVVIVAGLAGWLFVSPSSPLSDRSVEWQLRGFNGLRFDPTTAQTTTRIPVHVLYWPAETVPGDGSWLADPEIAYTPTSVTITLRTSDTYAARGAAKIVGTYDTGGWIPVQLSEPLRGRALFDGSTSPPAARPYPTVAEASAAAVSAAARASAAAAAGAVRASAAAQAVQGSCSINTSLNGARVIVLGDGSRTECAELAQTIDLGSGARMGDLRQPADPPTGGLICHATIDRWDVSVYDAGSATVGATACRYLVPKPYVGIVVQEVVQGLRLKDTTGPTGRVSAVYPGGPGSKAGLKAGDIVTRIDDTSIPSADDIDTIVAAHHIGDTLHLEVLRSGQTLSVDLVLEARPPTY